MIFISDNNKIALFQSINLWREQGSIVIKNTRIDTLWGLVNLMDRALEATPLFDARALILIGNNDQVINDKSMDLMLSLLPASAKVRQTIKRYKGGYHLLLRDLKGKRVWQDILNWVLLPSSWSRKILSALGFEGRRKRMIFSYQLYYQYWNFTF